MLLEPNAMTELSETQNLKKMIRNANAAGYTSDTAGGLSEFLKLSQKPPMAP